MFYAQSASAVISGQEGRGEGEGKEREREGRREEGREGRGERWRERQKEGGREGEMEEWGEREGGERGKERDGGREGETEGGRGGGGILSVLCDWCERLGYPWVGEQVDCTECTWSLGKTVVFINPLKKFPWP